MNVRYVRKGNAGQAGIAEWKIGPFGEMPRSVQADAGKDYRRGWYLTVDPAKFTKLQNGPADVVFNCLLRVSFPDGAIEAFSDGPGIAFNEPVHIPADDPEHGGWLMMMVDRVIAEDHFAQEVWILEADHIGKGPIARAFMPFTSCEQVHGTWVTRAELDQSRV